MIWHPLLMSVIWLDVLFLLLTLAAARTAIRTILTWRPESAAASQLALERGVELASFEARGALVLFSLATVVWITAITIVLPDIVSGAMCGTGVLEAMSGLGTRALILRGITLLLLLSWRLIDHLDQSDPRRPLCVTAARAFLLVVPAGLLAIIDTGRAILSLDLSQPVSCCAVVYDQARSVVDAQAPAGVNDATWLVLSSASFVSVLVFCVWRRLQSGAHVWLSWFVTLSATFWVVVTAHTLVYVLSAYHYEVLHHHCPFCLFLPDHELRGFVLFGLLFVVLWEGIAASILERIRSDRDSLSSEATRRQRSACFRVCLAALTFVLVALYPAVMWRLHFGVWL